MLVAAGRCWKVALVPDRRPNGRTATASHPATAPDRRQRERDRLRRMRLTRTIAAAAVLVVVVAIAAWLVLARAKPSATSTATAAGSKTATSAAPSATATTPAKASSPATGSASASTDTSWQKKYRGKIVAGFVMPSTYKAVALTFDDGPNWATPHIIDIVKGFGGKGTFFFSGKGLRVPSRLPQASLVENAGWEVANHTWDHANNGYSAVWKRTYSFDVMEITNPDKLMKPLIGHNTLWVRPMGGNIDATGIKAANDTGHLVINWSVDSGDSRGWKQTPEYVFHNSTTNIKSGDVILLHATHYESYKALPRICKELQRQGFQLVTVSDLAAHALRARYW
jgi:peptidoglycan-N-acetylglucosamine deacetylase